MKKIIYFSYLFLFLGTVGCKKDVNISSEESDSVEMRSEGNPNLKFNDLGVKSHVENGILVFESAEDLDKLTNFLGKATKSEIEKWENSLVGFNSVTKNYLNVRKSLSEMGDLDSLKIAYQGKVIIKDDGTVFPVIENGTIFGRIITEKGLYKVGSSLVKYVDGLVISIPDGDENKLAQAISSQKQDTKNGVYIHPLMLKDLAPNMQGLLQERAFCTNKCPISDSKGYTGLDNNLNEQYRIFGSYQILDNTSVVKPAGCGYASVNVNISVQIGVTMDKWTKPFLKSWRWQQADNSGGLNWGFGWDISMTIGGYTGFYYPPGAGSTPRTQTGGWTWDVTGGNVNVNIPLWKQQLCNDIFSEMAQKIADNGITICPNRTGLNATALNPILSTIKIQTYCQM
jgi:hypothetical protein